MANQGTQMTCPVCLASTVHASHRRGVLERGPLTWIGLLPFRCGQCQARFYRLAPRDPRRRHGHHDSDSPVDRTRPPRWETHMRAAVSLVSAGRAGEVVEGTAENASLEGVRVRLPVALPQGSQVSVSLEGGPARAGSVRWVQPHGESESLHGINFRGPVERRAFHARPFLRLRLRRWLRRGLVTLIGLGAMALAAYGLVSIIDALRAYDPWSKFYEPKDTERERFELQRRDEEMKRTHRP